MSGYAFSVNILKYCYNICKRFLLLKEKNKTYCYICRDLSVIEVSVFSKFLVLKSTMGRVLKKENGSTFSFPMQPFSTL